MVKKNTSKTTPRMSARRNPLLLQQDPLAFDNLPAEDIIALTPQQSADRFLSRWQEAFDPFENYSKTFKRGEKNADRILREIKLYFTKYVTEGSWTEQKYVIIINSILEARGLINTFSLDKNEKLYNEELLPLQVRLRRSNGGNS